MERLDSSRPRVGRDKLPLIPDAAQGGRADENIEKMMKAYYENHENTELFPDFWHFHEKLHAGHLVRCFPNGTGDHRA